MNNDSASMEIASSFQWIGICSSLCDLLHAVDHHIFASMASRLKNRDRVQEKDSTLKSSSHKQTTAIQQTRFFDLPHEVRVMIYKYLFDGAVLRVGKNGIEHKRSWGHCEMLQTCNSVRKEAEPALFSQATQVFSDIFKEHEAQEHNLNLRPLYPRLVPAINVSSFAPKNNVRLDMKTLRAYSHLRDLELGMFGEMLFKQAPYPILEHDIDIISADNDSYLVTELNKIFMDKIWYNKLWSKPISFQGLRGILQSKHRTFRVVLRCIVQIYCEDSDCKLPGYYDGVVCVYGYYQSFGIANQAHRECYKIGIRKRS